MLRPLRANLDFGSGSSSGVSGSRFRLENPFSALYDPFAFVDYPEAAYSPPFEPHEPSFQAPSAASSRP